MFAAEWAELVHLKTVRSIFLILDGIVVSLLAFIAPKCDFDAHYGTSNSIASLLEFDRIMAGFIQNYAQKQAYLSTGRNSIPYRLFLVKKKINSIFKNILHVY